MAVGELVTGPIGSPRVFSPVVGSSVRLGWSPTSGNEMQRPPSRPIRTARDAEEIACGWLRVWGFDDAVVTGAGADEGIDVVGSEVVAQVKAEARPIGRPVLQSLAGIALVEHKRSVFFALGGFTAEAVRWADRAEIALFTFDLAGDPEPVNARATDLMRQSPDSSAGRRSEALSPSPSPTVLPGPWAQPLPQQQLLAKPLQEGEFTDPKRLAATLRQFAFEQGRTVAGRYDGVWTPSPHRFLWSVEVDIEANDEECSSRVEVFHLRLPEWRTEMVPYPRPTHMETFDTTIEPDDLDLLEDMLDPEVLEESRRVRFESDLLTSELGLTLTYTAGPVDEVLTQVVADLSSVLLTLGHPLERTQVEVRDFKAEQDEVAHRFADEEALQEAVAATRYRVLVGRVPRRKQGKARKALRQYAGMGWAEAAQLVSTAPAEVPVALPVSEAVGLTFQLNLLGIEADSYVVEGPA